MARPIQYDREVVTDKALAIFWQDGFNRSSVDKLVQATGLNKHSLYKAFDGKDGLFLSCLARYIDRKASPYISILEQQPGLAAIREFMALVQDKVGLGTSNGCLVANTAVELGARNESVQTLVDGYYARMAAALARAMTQGQADRNIKAEIDPAVMAQWFVYVIQGLGVSSRYQATSTANVDALLALIATHPKKLM